MPALPIILTDFDGHQLRGLQSQVAAAEDLRDSALYDGVF
jgi:hypothetical protein